MPSPDHENNVYRSSIRSDKPFIPKGMDDIIDLLGSMMLSAPTFKDKTGYFPERNVETQFFSLNEGLKTIREDVGEENYQALVELSDKMRAYFESDPEAKTDAVVKGRNCIIEMEDILEASAPWKNQNE